MEKNLCTKSQEKFLEMLEKVELEKSKVFNNLIKRDIENIHTNIQYEGEKSVNKKLK